MTSLVAVCGVHLSSSEECRRFFETLDSYDKQTVKVPLYLGLSYNSEIIGEVRTALRKIHDLQIQLYISRTPRKQFEYYQTLISKIPGDPWVIFTNSGDLWNDQ